MTWTPKVGEWVMVDQYGVTRGPYTVGVTADGDRQVFISDPGMRNAGEWTYSEWLRPATIDEIPGNTATEEEHDRALSLAILDAAHRAVIVANEWSEIGGDERSARRLGHEDWP